MKCPECEKELGQGDQVEVGRIGWCCSPCNIKIYKDVKR